jgi:large subunit ribosomal protein L10
VVKEEKLKQVEELKKKIEKYSTICLLDMFKLPSKQLQQIAKELRGKAEIKVAKKSILIHAIRGLSKEKISELENHLPSLPAIIFTNLDAFRFYSAIDKLKSPTFVKEGDIAEEDIEIKAGPTSLLPGPVIGELSRAGIPAGIEEGKIAIKKDVIVAKKGDKISKALADVLKKLKIQPIKIGLNIVAIYENGKIYLKDILELIKTYPEKLKEAFNQALNLSINISYPTKENIKFLLVKAFNTAKNLERIGGVK